MQQEIAINDPKTASSLNECIGRQKMLEVEIVEFLKRQALLEADLKRFELVLIDATMDSEQAYLFVTAGIGKYAKHIVTAGIVSLLQLELEFCYS